MRLSSEIAPPNTRSVQPKRAPVATAELPPEPAPPTEEIAAETAADTTAALAESANDVIDITRLSGRVRFARTLMKLSKAELARRVGVCLSAAVQWELTKGTSPTVTNLVKIATIAGVAFEWLATGRGSPKLAGALQIPAHAEDLEFEMRLLVAARAVARDRRDVVIDLIRSVADQ
jgi:transcriptional regulator with XRE-family HTH domain